MIDIAVVWAFIIAFAVFVYVVMDGFDLGLGMLFPLFPKKEDRDVMMNSVAPVWDGNETWLVLGGGGLMAAFPLAYAVLMPALYTPMIVMLLGLVFRGVAFEFRWRTTRERNLWDIAFAGGSLMATLAQGVALGAILQGIVVNGRHYGGGWWDWLTPFSVLTGTRTDGRLRPARRNLAGVEDRRRVARSGLSSELVAAIRHARRHRSRSASRRHFWMPNMRGAGSPGPTSS